VIANRSDAVLKTGPRKEFCGGVAVIVLRCIG
jgi:hypothetical protein